MREEIRKLFPLEFYINDKEEMVAEMSINTLNKLIIEIVKLEKLIKKYDRELTHKTKQYEFLRHNESKEIKRLWKRNREVFNEMKKFIDNLDIENYMKLAIFNHLSTYLLFKTPIRKSDKK